MAAPKKKNEPSKKNNLKKQNKADNKKITKKSSKKKKAADKAPANKKATKKTSEVKKSRIKKNQVKNTKTPLERLEKTDSTGKIELTKIAEEERIAKDKVLKMEKKHQREQKHLEEEKKAEEVRIAEEKKIAEEARKAEEARIAEEKRKAEEEKKIKEAEKIKQVIKQLYAKEQQEAYEAEQNLSRENDNNTEASVCSYRNCWNINKSFLAAGISFIVILLMLIGTSWKNSEKFYIKNTKAGIEIMQGKFAPLHTRKFIFLKGAKISGIIRPSYNKDTIFPIIFNYYLNETDALMKKPGVPDIHGIMRDINKASEFALTPQDHQIINQYKTTIENTMAGIKAIIIPKMNRQKWKGAMNKALQHKKDYEYPKP